MLISLVLSELTNSFSKHLPAYLIRSLSHCLAQNCYLSQFNFKANVHSMNSCIHKTQIKGFAASFTNTRFKKPVQLKWKNSCKPNTYYIISRIWILLLFFPDPKVALILFMEGPGAPKFFRKSTILHWIELTWNQFWLSWNFPQYFLFSPFGHNFVIPCNVNVRDQIPNLKKNVGLDEMTFVLLYSRPEWIWKKAGAYCIASQGAKVLQHERIHPNPVTLGSKI